MVEKAVAGPCAQRRRQSWDAMMMVAHAQLQGRVFAQASETMNRQRIWDLERAKKNEEDELVSYEARTRARQETTLRMAEGKVSQAKREATEACLGEEAEACALAERCEHLRQRDADVPVHQIRDC